MTQQRSNVEHGQPRGLSDTLFKVIACFTVFLIALATCTSTLAYYYSSEKSELKNLSQASLSMASALNELETISEQIELLEHQLDIRLRYTLVSPDGEVLSDSFLHDDSLAPNHSNRPEIIDAQRYGNSTTKRYSYTLEQDMLYSAIKLDNGNILRVSELRESVYVFISHLFLPLTIASVLTAGFAFINSKILSRTILKPFEDFDISDTSKSAHYKEFMPILARIEDQQENLKNQNEHLIEAVQSRKTFIDNFSHELKTPLQIIAGYSELIKEGFTNEEETRKFSSVIYNETQHMKTLIEDLLSLSRLSVIEQPDINPVPNNLKDMCNEIFERLSPWAEKEDVHLYVTGNDAYVNADRELLKTLLTNLITNAIRYNKRGGIVEVNIAQKESSVELSVRDTGIGMTKESMDHIYERFYRADKSRSKDTGGTGIGLAIVKHIVLLCHGTINVESVLGEGTIFTIEIPHMVK